jgi:hypothetical protein
MICQTVKAGTECAFMNKKGCDFTGGSCQVIIEACQGCGKVMEYEGRQFCKTYADPGSKWRSGRCPSATHIKIEIVESTQKINPLKASKRATKKA